MTTLPRTRTPRTPPTPAEPITKVKIEIPEEGVETRVTQTPAGQTFEFDATIKPDREELESENIDFNEILLDNIEDVQDIPKTSLEKMFDDLRHGIKEHGIYDQFFANITRLPDSMTDKFFNPCRDQIPGMVVQFNTSDQFNFIPALQNINGDSGGRFNIRVYDINQQPLEIPNPLTFDRTLKPIVLSNLYVPNPPPKPITDNTQNPLTLFTEAINKLDQKQRDFEQKIFNEINRKPEKSTLEIAMEQKMIDLIVNGNQQGSSQLETTLATMFGMPVIVEKMAKKMFPDAPASIAEETTWDKVAKMVETPAGQKFVERVGDAVEKVPTALLMMRGNSNGQPPASPFTEPPDIQNPMQNTNTVDMTEEELTPAEELLNSILNELNSDNPIDATNETIKQLGAIYPIESTIIVSMCKSMTFADILQILSSRYPFAFEGVYETVLDEKQQPLVRYTELGERLIGRLEEFYKFVRTDQSQQPQT